MMISFIVPAYNEELLLPRTLERLLASAQAVREPFEVIVVDDGSTDRTAAIAQGFGARVVGVKLRNIGAVRNAGAREARGELLVFVDADTLLPEAALRAALATVRAGAVGGGAVVRADEALTVLPRGMLAIWNGVSRAFRWAAGCFVFVRRDAFEAVGGFDEQYYVTEELHLSAALKKRGRFVILREPVITSARKVHMYPMATLVRNFFRILFSGPRAFRSREGLGMWYEGRRK